MVPGKQSVHVVCVVPEVTSGHVAHPEIAVEQAVTASLDAVVTLKYPSKVAEQPAAVAAVHVLHPVTHAFMSDVSFQYPSAAVVQPAKSPAVQALQLVRHAEHVVAGDAFPK